MKGWVAVAVFLVAVTRTGVNSRERRSSHSDESTSTTSSVLVSEQEAERVQQMQPRAPVPAQPWISQLFREAEEIFRVDSAASEPCRRAYELFEMYLRNQTVWAVRMKESSEWPVVALLSGKMFHLGDWDECLASEAVGFKGQYCLVQSLIRNRHERRRVNRSSSSSSENSSARDVTDEEALAPRNWSRRAVEGDRHIVNWALCVPSTCAIADMKLSFDNIVRPVFSRERFDVTFRENSFSCSTGEPRAHTAGFYIASIIFACVTFLVVSSTAYDTLNNKVEGESSCWFIAKLYKCFSARQNLLNLTRFSSLSTTNPGVSVIKVVCIIGIIRGHRLFHETVYPTHSTENAEIVYRTRDLTAISLTAVDIFFMLSGFLMFHLGYKNMKKFGLAYLFLFFVTKWMRTAPVVILLQLFIIYIFPHLADGPLWNIRVQPTADMCKAAWWTDLLAVTNMVNSKPQCLPILWFVAVDIQLTIIGGVLLYVATKNTKIGAALAMVTFLVFVEIVGILVYRRQYRGVLQALLQDLEDGREADQFYKLYISPITRVGPYLIGFGAAFLVKCLKDFQCSLTGRMKAAIIVVTFIISRLYIFYEVGLTTRPYVPVEHAIYTAFKRSFYVLPVAGLFCIYFAFGYGKFDVLFEWKPCIAFGRLVYSVYSVHFIFQMFHSASRREYKSFEPMIINEVWSVTADTVTSFFLAFLFYLIAEGPINSMAKLSQSYFVRPQVQPALKSTLAESSKEYSNHAFVVNEVQSDLMQTTAC